MTDFQPDNAVGDAATIDTVAAVMVERFGAHAASVATDQLAAAHASAADIADRWLSIGMSIEERLNAGRTVVPPVPPQSTAGYT